MNYPTPAVLPSIPVTLHDGQVFVSSKIVAEYFDKQHKDVLKKIAAIDCSEEFGRRNFAPSSYLNMQGKEQPLYEITRDGFMFLAMGFTGARAAAVKEAFIAQFNQMETMLRGGDALPALAQAVGQTQVILARLAEKVAATESKVDAILTLVDVAGKYIALLEGNQKGKPRNVRPITPQDEIAVKDLLAQGMPGAQVAVYLGISTAAVSLIRNGLYKFRTTIAPKQESLLSEVEGGAA